MEMEHKEYATHIKETLTENKHDLVTIELFTDIIGNFNINTIVKHPIFDMVSCELNNIRESHHKHINLTFDKTYIVEFIDDLLLSIDGSLDVPRINQEKMNVGDNRES